jgi:hypothetical protein
MFEAFLLLSVLFTFAGLWLVAKLVIRAVVRSPFCGLPAYRDMDPSTERRGIDNAHVRRWKLWYSLEGRHFDNANRHPDYQLPPHS